MERRPCLNNGNCFPEMRCTIEDKGLEGFSPCIDKVNHQEREENNLFSKEPEYLYHFFHNIHPICCVPYSSVHSLCTVSGSGKDRS